MKILLTNTIWDTNIVVSTLAQVLYIAAQEASLYYNIILLNKGGKRLALVIYIIIKAYIKSFIIKNGDIY